MKTKFKLLFLVLGTLSLFFACQKEDSIEPEAPSEYKIKTLTAGEVASNQKLSTTLKKFNPKTSVVDDGLSSRQIYNAEYGFTIRD